MKTNIKKWGGEQARIIEESDFKNKSTFSYWKYYLKHTETKADLIDLYDYMNDFTNEAIKDEIEGDILKLLVDETTPIIESIKVYFSYCFNHGYESTSAEALNQFCAIVRK